MPRQLPTEAGVSRLVEHRLRVILREELAGFSAELVRQGRCIALQISKIATSRVTIGKALGWFDGLWPAPSPP